MSPGSNRHHPIIAIFQPLTTTLSQGLLSTVYRLVSYFILCTGDPYYVLYTALLIS
jgi:hypothetical protein